MCFVHKPMQNADFGQILCRRYKMSRDLATDGPIFANLVSKDAQDLKEKSHEKAWSVAVARQSRISCRGGVKLTPPPVKIGLKVTRRRKKIKEFQVAEVLGPNHF